MKKIIIRIVELIIIITTIVLTRSAIDYATTLRGYVAYGGEYLILAIGFIALVMTNELKN